MWHLSATTHCKNTRTFTNILWRVFHILAESYTFVYVNRRNNEARADIAIASLFRRFTDTNVYGTGSVKIWKTRHKNPWMYGYFYGVRRMSLLLNLLYWVTTNASDLQRGTSTDRPTTSHICSRRLWPQGSTIVTGVDAISSVYTTRGLAVASIARDVGSSSTNRSSDIMHFLPRLHERL